MDIVTSSCTFLQQCADQINPQIRKRFEFGFKAISLQGVESLNSAARCVVPNVHTAESKMYRLLKTERFLTLFPSLITHLELVKKDDRINIDFSTFDEKQVLMFAKQTEDGRALPLYFETIIYPIDEGSQNIFIIEAIKHFRALIGNCTASLVFDRGFAIPSLIEFLAQESAVFYIRIKAGKQVEDPDTHLVDACRTLSEGAHTVSVYGLKLRVIVTPAPENGSEPWYIVTNDFNSTTEKIQDIYYHRFEIEEFFKDTKHPFGLACIHFKKLRSFHIVLWFVILGTWLCWSLQKTCAALVCPVKKYPHCRELGVISFWLERITCALITPSLATISLTKSL